MADIRQPLFDTAVFVNAAGGTFTLFQVPVGGDTTHTKDFTNMRGSGSLPVNENFTVDRIVVYPDEQLVEADINLLWEKSLLSLWVSDKQMLNIPLRMLAGYAAFGGLYTQAAAAAGVVIGPLGDGFKLDKVIPIDGGDSFKVEVYQGTALSVATFRVKVVMDGILNRPQ